MTAFPYENITYKFQYLKKSKLTNSGSIRRCIRTDGLFHSQKCSNKRARQIFDYFIHLNMMTLKIFEIRKANHLFRKEICHHQCFKKPTMH